MVLERIRLDGRVVVVSGAGGGGIGTACARAAAEAGASVVGLDVDARALAVTAASVEDAGGRFVGLTADATDEAAVAGAVAEAASVVGPPDGLVCVVGGTLPAHWGPTLTLPLASWHDQLRWNLTSALVPCRVVAAACLARGAPASLVCLSSIAGDRAAPYHAAYGAAKAAIRHLVGTLAVEWGGRGIRVNAVAPGTIRTPRARPGDVDAERDRVVPLRRRGEPDEVGAAALFLLSDLSSYVTGHTLVVDGGAGLRAGYLDDDDLPVFVTNAAIRARARGDPGG